jgi:hypothetical protein
MFSLCRYGRMQPRPDPDFNPGGSLTKYAIFIKVIARFSG